MERCKDTRFLFDIAIIQAKGSADLEGFLCHSSQMILFALV
jgi:hypothetical protein